MIQNSFQIALDYTLQNEGSRYVADPADKGKCSRYGVTLASLSAWRGRPCTCDDVSNITTDECFTFYRLRYWDAMHLGQLGSQSTSTALFDMGVLNGQREAVKVMQEILDLLQDGVMGPKTVAAINSHTASFVVPLYAQMMQLHFLAIVRKDATQAKFLPGWLNRATKLLLLAV